MMTTIYKFDNSWVKSTGGVHADGSVTEMAAWRMRTVALDTLWEDGMVFPTIDAWVSAMVAETDKQCPWYAGRHNYKLSYIQEDAAAARSSVVWVPSKKHFMEIRRGPKTKIAPAERRYWLSVEEWVASLTSPPAVAVAAAAAAAVVEAKPAFDAEIFKANWDYLLSWVIKQSGTLHSAGVIQLTEYLLRPGAAATSWLAENQCWCFCVRAQLQALSWSTEYKEAQEAAAAFLEKF